MTETTPNAELPSAEVPPAKLPTLDDLYQDKEVARATTALNAILNATPKPEWIVEHPMVRNLKYIPIERIEYLLTSIFLSWRVEIKEVKQLANSVIVTVRLHTLNPITNTWDFQDGVGAMGIQTDSGASAADLSKVKSNAIQLGAPAAKSFAIKDAAENLGRIFGKDLNRKNGMDYAPLKSRFTDGESLKGFSK